MFAKISDWTKNANVTDEMKASITKEWINEVAKGGGINIIEVTDKKVKEANLRANPKIATYPKTGKMQKDKKGNVAIVYPDGSFEEIR
jgi:hypothetical protein